MGVAPTASYNTKTIFWVGTGDASVGRLVIMAAIMRACVVSFLLGANEP